MSGSSRENNHLFQWIYSVSAKMTFAFDATFFITLLKEKEEEEKKIV